MLDYIEPTDNKDLNKFKLSENQLVSAGVRFCGYIKMIKVTEDWNTRK